MKYLMIAVGFMICGVIGGLSQQALAADTYRLKQWIAPLECTKNNIVDGISTQTYLTPEECNDLLNPPEPKPYVPKAPDTGYEGLALTGLFSTTTLMFIILFRLLQKRK